MGARVLFLQLQVSAAVILILILRQGMKRLPKIYSYLLWILIFGRLLCPFSLESRIGIMPSLEEGIHWVEGLRSQGAGEKDSQEREKGTWDEEEPGELLSQNRKWARTTFWQVCSRVIRSRQKGRKGRRSAWRPMRGNFSGKGILMLRF